MQTNVLLPQVELTMESALVAKWLVRAGDRVNAEQPILEVETQKATSEVPTPVAGFVRKLCVSEGQHIPEKSLICIITETADEPFNEGGAPQASTSASAATSTPAAAAAASDPSGAIKAAPAARRVAKELGVDLASVKGTGPGGRISEEDVRAAASGGKSSGASSGDWQSLPASRVALIAQMKKSLAEIPQIHIRRQIDVTPLSVKAEGVTFTHRLVVAVAASLKQHPAVRTMIDGDKIKVEPVSVAIAMDTKHGLVAPVIRNADSLALPQISKAVNEYREKAEAGTLRKDEMTNAPFAITNLGMLGVDQFDAFVFHGQTAVLAVSRAVDSGGKKLAWFSLAVDHRVVDGAGAARFLETLQTEILRK